ncbi:MAG: OmpH family outer membrane protein [Acidobacteria bacterium]|nr:OmpH family outer membrane protein [Acidobacteriota bacterium]
MANSKALSFEMTVWHPRPFQVPIANPMGSILGTRPAIVAVAVPAARASNGKVTAPLRASVPVNVSVNDTGVAVVGVGATGPGSSQAAAVAASVRTARLRVSKVRVRNGRLSTAGRMASSVLGLASAARSTLSFLLERCRYRPLMSRQTITMAILAVFVAGNSLAQTAPPVQTPPVQNPPATTAKPPAPAVQPPAPPVQPPFPVESKIGFVDLQSVVAQSVLGKAGSQQYEALGKKLEGELTGLQGKLKDAQTRQQTQSALLSEVAAATLAKDIDRLTRELTFKQQEAQSELQTLQQDLLGDFEKKVMPILESLAKERNLHIVFNVENSGAVYVFPGLNLSPELVKRVDAQYSAKK